MALSLKKLLLLTFSLLAGVNFTSAQQADQQLFEVSATKYMLGTTVDMKAMHPDIQECKMAFYYGYEEIQRIENLFSSNIDNSEISRINRSAGTAPVKVSQETFNLLKRAKEYGTEFNGIFDVSIGPVTELWGFNSDNHDISLPAPNKLSEKLLLVDYNRIILNQVDTTVFLPQEGMQLDVGGIAKGYAIDRAAAVLKSRGLKHFFINAGGDIYAAGYKQDGKNWIIGIQDPRKSDGLLATFQGHDITVATSGDYERYKIIDGKRYHHIIDPRTGYSGMRSQSVTVFANSAEEADAWSTYLFLIGVNEFEQQPPPPPEIQACFVDANGNIEYDASLGSEYNLNFLVDAPAQQLIHPQSIN